MSLSKVRPVAAAMLLALTFTGLAACNDDGAEVRQLESDCSDSGSAEEGGSAASSGSAEEGGSAETSGSAEDSSSEASSGSSSASASEDCPTTSSGETSSQ